MQYEDIKDLSLDDIAQETARLWQDYFRAPKVKKDPIQKEYNILANEYNKRVQRKDLVIITSATKDNIKYDPAHICSNLSSVKTVESKVKEFGEDTIIGKILKLHKEGKTNKEIIALGYNKSTVGRQVSEYKKSIQ